MSSIYSKKNKGGGKSFLGFFKNFGTDVKDAAYGFFPGIGGLVVDPILTAKNIYKGFGETSALGPLFVGDFGIAAKRLYEHPLSPILDVSTIFTGGGAIAGKAASLAGRPVRELAIDRALAVSSKIPEEDIVKGLTYRIKSKNPSTRLRQNITDKISNDLSSLFPVWKSKFGSVAKYEKGLKKELSGRKKSTAYAARLFPQIFIDGAKKYTTGEDIGNWGIKVIEQARDNFKYHAARYDPKLRSISPKVESERSIPGQQSLFKLDKEIEDITDLPKGFILISKEYMNKKPILTSADFEKRMATWTKDNTVTDIKLAAKDENGKYYLAFKHDAERWGTEARRSGALMKMLYNKPQTLWKWSVLFRPAYVMNNTVGSAVMAAMTANPVEFFGGMMSAIKHTKGLKAAEDFIDEGYKTANRGYKRKNYLDIYEGMFGDIGEQLHLSGKQKITRAVDKTAMSMFSTAHKIEQAIRGKVIDEYVIRQPEVRAFMKEGYSFEQAASKASEDTAFRARVKNNLEDRLGQYYHQSPWEKNLRQIRPFYGWDRAIVRHVANLTGPRKAALGYTGMYGSQLLGENIGTDVPSGFMTGNIPLGQEGKSILGIPGMKGRMPVLSTGSTNPYAAFADIMGMATGTGGEVLGGVSPLISTPIGVITGKNPITGEPIPNRLNLPGPVGLVGNTAANIVETLPQSKLISSIFGLSEVDRYTTKLGKQPFLYSRQWQELLAAYLGVPIKQISPAAVTRKAGLEKRVGRF